MSFSATSKFPTSIAQVADLLNQINQVATNPQPLLAAGINNAVTTMSVGSGQGAQFPTDNFVISIDNEIIFVGSRSTDTFNSCTRGYEGTSAASHSSSAPVNAYMTALAHNQAVVEINAVETALGALLFNVLRTTTQTLTGPGTFTLDGTKGVTLVNATASGTTINLPAASGGKGALVIASYDATGGVVTINGFGNDTVNESLLFLLQGQNQMVILFPDGVSNWLGMFVSPTMIASGTQLLTGGGVDYTGTGFNFTVGAATYLIAGSSFSSPLTNVTLAASDPSNDRIDVIGVDDTGTVFVLQGTPAATPAQPTVDPTEQLELTFVTIAAGSSTPGQVTKYSIYHENTEWTTSKSGTQFNLASTNNPYDGTVDIEATAAPRLGWVQFDNPGGPLDPATVNILVLYIRSKATWNANRSLSLQFQSSGAVKGTPVILKDGTFGFSSAFTTGYQQISIPVTSFGANGILVNQLRVTVSGTGASTIGFYVDAVSLQGGINPTGLPSGLMIYRGNYSATAAYNANDVTISSGATFVALQANTGKTPATNPTFWTQIAPPSSDLYVLGARDSAGLTNSIGNPTVYYGPDVMPSSAGTLDDEFAGSSLNTSTRWTWVNQGVAIATVGKSILNLSSVYASNANSDQIAAIVQTTPSTPWEVTVKIVPFMFVTNENGQSTGLVIRDSGTGKMIIFGFGMNGANLGNYIMLLFKFDSATSKNGDYLTSSLFPAMQINYLRVKDDGSNLTFSFSVDGVLFMPFSVQARTAYLATPNQVGLFVNPNLASQAYQVSMACDWFRRTV